MSVMIGLSVKVYRHDKALAADIVKAVNDVWDFEAQDYGDYIDGYAELSMSYSSVEEQGAEVGKAVFAANGNKRAEIEVIVTWLEQAPYDYLPVPLEYRLKAEDDESNDESKVDV